MLSALDSDPRGSRQGENLGRNDRLRVQVVDWHCNIKYLSAIIFTDVTHFVIGKAVKVHP